MESRAALDRWDRLIAGIEKSVRREARRLCVLGILSYAMVCVLAFRVFGETMFAGLLVTGFFQLMVVYMATEKMYVCIRAGFLANLEGSRETVPAFGEMGTALKDATEVAHLVRTTLERYAKDGDVIRGTLERIEQQASGLVARLESRMDRVEESLTRPIGKPRRPGLLETGIPDIHAAAGMPPPENGAGKDLAAVLRERKNLET